VSPRGFVIANITRGIQCFIAWTIHDFKSGTPETDSRRLTQDGFHGMYLEEKDTQTKTRDAGNVRDTKSINLCSRAQKKDKYALGIHGECTSKATTLIS
jgi:hypothetical protein